jgi:hypothetical protein
LFVTVLIFIAGILFDLYFCLNMTKNGLVNALIIFGIAMVIDFILIRTILITIASIIIVKRGKNINYDSIIDEEEKEILLIG